MPNKQTVYVVDTNVIINDPDFVKKLKGKILIPKAVLEELDKHKYGANEKARNIRDFARFLDKHEDELWFYDSDIFEGSNDDKIIKTAKNLEARGEDVVLVTNDILMGLMAKSVGLNIQKHKPNQLQYEHYTGIRDCRTDLQYGQLIPNEYQIHDNGLFRVSETGALHPLGKDRYVWGVKHHSVEQRCVIDALTNPEIQLVTITGKAGTGKTLLAIAAGLDQTLGENAYQRIIIARPTIPMGQDIGFLPGDINEKLNPWMQPIFDNIDFLFSLKKNKAQHNEWQRLIDDGVIQMEALSHIRGRSIPFQYIIIDEAQNLSKHELKTIISRAGEGTKIVLTGDLNQIDHPKLDSVNNGLNHVVSRFKKEPLAAHIMLKNCERSRLADRATELL